ncbi:retinol-binding protein pinta [Phlebotomus argentipes]|uniref:retinol-binding protein pinta n=1 Tax=Phlebotomus argentipes TaxID=94469 RepID=UPI00289346A2|nr:retinol-binding protein pinta [Phlebotomus argentipes]
MDYTCSLSSECYNFAEANLNETPNERADALAKLCTWIDENAELNVERDTVHLLYFLRGAKFNIEKAKDKIKRFYRMRAERSEWFSNRNPFHPELDELLKIGVCFPLRERDEHNRLVVVIRTGAHNPRKQTQNDVLKICKMLIDLAIRADESISIYGVSAVLDMTGVTLSHALQLTPTIIKRTVECWETYPCRARRMEFVNAPAHVHVILNIFRSFMSSKLKDRVYVTKGLPKNNENLPANLGGHGPSYQELAVYWRKKAQDSADWFARNEQYKMTI